MKIAGTERTHMLQTIKAKLEEGCKPVEVINHINRKFNVDYKFTSFRYLRNMSTGRIGLQERQQKYQEYMQKCKKEYESEEKTAEPSFLQQIIYKGNAA